MSALLWTLVLVAGAAVTWWGSGRIESAGERLSRRYGLPPIVEGTLVVAVGSSAPELATTVISTVVHGAFELGMATIVGSAVFNVLVIPGLSVVAAGPLRPDIRLVYRDALFYLTSVATLLLVFSFALIYAPLPGPSLTGELTRLPAAVPLALYLLYLFLQREERRDVKRGGDATRGRVGGTAAASREEPEPNPDPDPQDETQPGDAQRDRVGAATDAGGPANQANTGDPGRGRAYRDWLLLAAGVVAVVAGVEALLRVALHLEAVLGTPSFLWGATVLAAVTSIPDALISIRTAREGNGSVSLGNVLGSNIFDLLVAIPAGVLVAGAATVRYGVAAPLMAALTLATIVLFTAMRTRLVLSRREGWLLLALYGLFVLWLGLETAGVTGWVGGG